MHLSLWGSKYSVESPPWSQYMFSRYFFSNKNGLKRICFVIGHHSPIQSWLSVIQVKPSEEKRMVPVTLYNNNNGDSVIISISANIITSSSGEAIDYYEKSRILNNNIFP